jgi:L-glyceraldehyde 3-phosphate reductase
MPYTPSPARYDKMIYNRCGRSGLKLPTISLGLSVSPQESVA